MNRLYTEDQFQQAYQHWSRLGRETWGDERAWLFEREERWLAYCDIRDHKPKGSTKTNKLWLGTRYTHGSAS